MGSGPANLIPGETASHDASYLIEQNAANSGAIINTVSVTASSPGQSNDVSDISDDGDDTDGNTVDDKTIVQTQSDATIEVTKTAQVTQNDGNLTNDAGDLITYTITVENTGNVNLSNIQITDNLKDASNNNLSLTTSLTRDYPVVEINVTVGAASLGGNAYYFDGVEKAQITLERGRVYKFIQSSGTNLSHPIAFSTTNDGTHGGGNAYNTGVTSSGTAGNNGAYTQITVDQNLTALHYYCVNHPGMGSNFVISNPSNIISASTVVTYTGTYLIEQSAANTGKVINSATVVASSPGGNGDVSDVSDDGDDTDGNTTNDPTEITTSTDFSIAVVKTATVNDNNSNGKVDVGDRIDYSITVSNTGNAI